MQWTALAQVLAPPNNDGTHSLPSKGVSVAGAEAATVAWLVLLEKPARPVDRISSKIQSALKTIIRSAMKCFGDLLLQLEDMEEEPDTDTYAWETMAESLVRASPIVRTNMPAIVVFILLFFVNRNSPRWVRWY